MQLIFLFRLDLTLHACKFFIRCDSFEILNFTSKQGVYFGVIRGRVGWQALCRRSRVIFLVKEKMYMASDWAGAQRGFTHFLLVTRVSGGLPKSSCEYPFCLVRRGVRIFLPPSPTLPCYAPTPLCFLKQHTLCPLLTLLRPSVSRFEPTALKYKLVLDYFHLLFT